ncbi:MAG TPA: diguanylate cyclase [Petrotogaceae bacterium]|jgi:GGDEF domain-containing protein|nr:diguanylate cyclase [Petrotogaceae bacterium]HNV04557.1 diguanylate cyclase [Petrotogaceae bacterium]
MNSSGEVKKLEKRVLELEGEVELYKQKLMEMDYLVEQYNELVKNEFNSFDDFVQNLVTRKIIDENTRVYSKDFFDKLFAIYYQKSFELKKECGIIILTIPALKSSFGEAKKRMEREVGKVLRESVRIPLDFIARYHEDRFVILLTDIVDEVFEKITVRIQDRLEMLCDRCGNIGVVKHYIPLERISLQDIFEELNDDKGADSYER